jgi:hypothetical protein
MGCDIHLVVERRRTPAERWFGIYSSDQGPRPRAKIAQRDYDFFAHLANVRGSGPNYPRNVPEDISALAWQEYMSAPTNHHSASHMSVAEFCAAYLKIRPEGAWADHAAYDLLGIWSDSPEGAEYRVVFWFDN